MSEDMTTATAATMLDEAARHIEIYGWQRGRLGGKGGPCCAIGATTVAWDGLTARTSAAWRMGMTALAETIGTKSLSQWNDAPERTADEVITALLEAAARLRGEGSK